MSKKPYVAPELVTLGDVVSITQATADTPFHPDAQFNFQNPLSQPNFPDISTDNIAGN